MLGVVGNADTQSSGEPQTCAQAPLGLFGLYPIEMCHFPEGEGASPSPTHPWNLTYLFPTVTPCPADRWHGGGQAISGWEESACWVFILHP